LVEIVNLTPHPIVITNGPTFYPSGTVARVATDHVYDGTINGVPVYRQAFGDIENLPAPSDDTIYIVSSIVLAAATDAGRTDCVAPDTARAVRDDNGHIVSVPGFIS